MKSELTPMNFHRCLRIWNHYAGKGRVTKGARFSMSSIETYQDFARFYDWYVRDFSADLPLYLNFCGQSDRIMEVGCGTGRVLKCLAEAGRRAFGVDISEEMLAIARTNLVNHLTAGQIRLHNFDFTHGYLEEKFDRVLVTFYTLNYLLDENDCERFLGHIGRSMADQALILIDLFYPKPLEKPDSSDKWFEQAVDFDGQSMLLRDKRKMSGSLEERIQEYLIGESKQRIVTQRRFYTQKDILKILLKCGFSNIEFTNGYDLGGFHPLLGISETVPSSFVVKAEKSS